MGGCRGACTERHRAAQCFRRQPNSTEAIRGEYFSFLTRFIAAKLNELGGLIVGIAGLDVIGRAVARLFRAAWDNVEAVLIRGEVPRSVLNL